MSGLGGILFSHLEQVWSRFVAKSEAGQKKQLKVGFFRDLERKILSSDFMQNDNAPFNLS